MSSSWHHDYELDEKIEEHQRDEERRKKAFIEKACTAYCKVCDTQECEGTFECGWVKKFEKQLKKEL